MNIDTVNNEVIHLINELRDNRRQVILRLDPDIDMSRSISNQELELRVTEGKNAICKSSCFYGSIIPEMVEKGILMKEKNSSSYIITGLGWRVWKRLNNNPIETIPQDAELHLNDVISQIGKVEHLAKYPELLKVWSEMFSTNVRRFSTPLSKKGKDTQKEYISALGLITWNHLYQPVLLKNQEFLGYINYPFETLKGRIFSLIKFFDWEYCSINENSWFVCKDHYFWKTQYQSLYRYFMSRTPINNLLRDLRDIAILTKELLGNLDINKKINELAFSKLKRQIRSLKGHFWPIQFKKDLSWLNSRLEILLLKGE